MLQKVVPAHTSRLPVEVFEQRNRSAIRVRATQNQTPRFKSKSREALRSAPRATRAQDLSDAFQMSSFAEVQVVQGSQLSDRILCS